MSDLESMENVIKEFGENKYSIPTEAEAELPDREDYSSESGLSLFTGVLGGDDFYKRAMLMDFEAFAMGNSNTKTMQKTYFKNSSSERNAKLAEALLRYVFEKVLQWTPEQVATYANSDVIKNLSLSYCYSKLELPRELVRNEEFHVAALLYPHLRLLNTEELTILTYKHVLGNSNGKFPKEYFLDGSIGQKRAVICLRYLLKYRVKFTSIEEMFEYFTNEKQAAALLKKYSIYTVRETLYDSCLEYLKDAMGSVFGTIELLYNKYMFGRIYTETGLKSEVDKMIKKVKKPAVNGFAASFKTFRKNFSKKNLNKFWKLFDAVDTEEVQNII